MHQDHGLILILIQRSEQLCDEYLLIFFAHVCIAQLSGPKMVGEEEKGQLFATGQFLQILFYLTKKPKRWATKGGEGVLGLS